MKKKDTFPLFPKQQDNSSCALFWKGHRISDTFYLYSLKFWEMKSTHILFIYLDIEYTQFYLLSLGKVFKATEVLDLSCRWPKSILINLNQMIDGKSHRLCVGGKINGN